MDIKITTEFIKLQQLLKFAGVCSTGAEAKMVILDGLVSVGGEVCLLRGKKMYPGDSCEYNGTKISVT